MLTEKEVYALYKEAFVERLMLNEATNEGLARAISQAVYEIYTEGRTDQYWELKGDEDASLRG